jgi:hypothetical protein
MRDEDRLFLREYANFVCLSHPIAAIALRRAAVDATEVAVVAEGRTRRLDRAEAEKVAASGNTAALVQTYVVARLLAELAAAIEDLGALLDAVRYRDRLGILHRYLKSQPGQVADVWDLVLSGVSPTDLLRLPALEALAPEPPAAIVSDYESLARSLPQIATMFRTRTDAEPVLSGTGKTAPADDVAIVTTIVDAGSPVSGATLVDAYNKIKHRFTVIDDIALLGSALSRGGRMAAYVRYPRDPAKAEVLYQNVMTVAAAGGEVAALVLWIEELGLLPPGEV